MIIRAERQKPENTKSEAVILGHFEKETFFYPSIDQPLKGTIAKAIREKKFTGEFKQLYSVNTLGLLSPDKIVLIGLGKKKEFDIEKLRKVSAITAKALRDSKVRKFSTNLVNYEIQGSDLQQKSQAMTEGIILGLYNFDRYKTSEKDRKKKVDEIIMLTEDTTSVTKGIKKGKILSDATNYVRDLVNMPPIDATPTYIANEAKRLAKKNRIKIRVLGKREMEKKKMGAILGVSKGSSQEPKLILMETNPKAKKKIAIVGKGITFDSGGLNLKPGDFLFQMKSDMAGSAAVLGIVVAASQLKIPVNVLGVMVLSENMTGAAAQKPGDIITAYNGKTIEIGNTDAEGRLVLADAVAYTCEENPDALIDIATLTGACVVTLGYSAAVLVSNDDHLKASIKKSADDTFERVWELPLWDDYRDGVKGELADLRNMGMLGKGYEAGSLVAATFIENFVVKGIPWAHLDIAGTAYLPESKEYIPKNATGYGVRLMINLLENWK